MADMMDAGATAPGAPQGAPQGLLARAAGQMTQGGPMPGAEPANDAGGGVAASPEEQAMYDRFVKNAYKLIYDVNADGKGTVRKGVLESLKGAGDPKEGLATTAVSVAKRVADSAAEAGVDLDGEIILHAGKEILEDLADLQVQAGIADLSEDDIEGAFYRAADLYRETAQAEGKLDTGVLARDFKAMQDADAAGRLDDVVPGATQAAERMKMIAGKGA